MKNFRKKHKKGFAAVCVVLILACYLFATGAIAQSSTLTSTNANITYNKETLSYGDVWAFDSTTHEKTSYNLTGSTTLDWYTSGGAGNTTATKYSDSNGAAYPTNYFEKADVSDGKLYPADTSKTIPMEKLAFTKFNSNVTAGTVASTVASAPAIPVVKPAATGNGIYSVVPGRGDPTNGVTYYVHVYKEGAAEDSLTLNYAMLDSCSATNAYATTSTFPEAVVLTPIGENTGWYRGEISVKTVRWYAASISCTPSEISNNEKTDNTGHDTFYGGEEKSLTLGGGGNSTTYYYNVWSNNKAYYNTVLVFKIPSGTALGPIGTGGSVVLDNEAASAGTITAQSIFGENIEVKSVAQTLVNMPIVLTAVPNGDASFIGFNNADGSIPTYSESDGVDNANSLQGISTGEESSTKTYVYYHENTGSITTKVIGKWEVQNVAMPNVIVSGDNVAGGSAEFNFTDKKSGSATFTKGTKTDFTFTLDTSESDPILEVGYTVSGDTVGDKSEFEYTVQEPYSFTVSPKFDETTVKLTVRTENKTDVFTYTMTPVTSGEATVLNYNTNKNYVFIEDALKEAESGHRLILLKNASFASVADGVYSTDWLNNGGYTVKSGVTLHIPFDDANTLITEMKGNTWGKTADEYASDPEYFTNVPASTEYRRLTMPSGVSLSVGNGAVIVVGSKTHVQTIGQVGPYGCIVMDAGSNITLESGATLYAWGYIFAGEGGAGTITVNSKATVYENCTIEDYPLSAGGCLNIYAGKEVSTSELAGAAISGIPSGGAFPLRSYYIYNVEVPMTFHYGSTESVFYTLYGQMVGLKQGYVNFIGSDSSAVFQLQAGGTLEKSYSDQKLHFKVKGSGTKDQSIAIINQLALDMGEYDLLVTKIKIDIYSSKTSGLDLPAGYNVYLDDGTLTLNDNLVLYGGSKITVGNNATVNLNGKKVYVMDEDDDCDAATETPGAVSAKDVHGNVYTEVTGDSVIDVNGTINAGSGLYCSTNKASIISSEGTGVIVVDEVPAAAQITTKINLTAWAKKDVVAASLKNGDAFANTDKQYTETSQGAGTYTYIDGYWHKDTSVHVDNKVNSDQSAGYDNFCDVCGHQMYNIGWDSQIGLIEPWFLCISTAIQGPNGIMNQEQIAALSDYGFYFIKASELNGEATLAGISADGDALKISKGDERVSFVTTTDGVTMLSARFSDELYTYKMDEDIHVAFYVTYAEGKQYAELESFNLVDLLEVRKSEAGDSDTGKVWPVLERNVYTEMYDLNTDITVYREGKIDTPTTMGAALAEDWSAKYSEQSDYKFGVSSQIVLIEPWGLQINAAILPAAGESLSDHIDYSADNIEYGVVMYYDLDGDFNSRTNTAEETTEVTPQELLALTGEAYVFSKTDGSAFVNSGNTNFIAARFNEGIYTYQLDTTLYTLFFVKIDDTYYFDRVRVFNAHKLCTERGADEGIDTVEAGVYNDMTGLYTAVKAYRDDYFAKQNTQS